MPDNNQFDEFFRSRLLDHSSPVKKGAWKSIHSQLGRVKAFHFWKWYVAGPVVVVVAVIAAHFVLSPVKSPAKPSAASPAATLAAAPSSIPVTAAASSSTPTTTTSPSPAAAATTTPSSAATRPTIISAAGNTTVRLSPTTHTTHRRTTHQTSDPAAGAGLNTRTAGNSSISTTTPGSDPSFSRSRTAGLTDPSQADALTTSSQATTLTTSSQAAALPAKDQRQSTPHHLTKPSIVRLSIPPSITAKAPKLSSQALVAKPARTRHGLDLKLDLYGSPDFPNKQWGFSYTGGARVNVALNEHWSATSGFQFSRINAHEVNSTIGLYPGYFNNVDLPILIGYTFTPKSDLTFTARAGVIFSLYSQAHGQLTNYPFGSRRGPGAYLGFEISKPLGDRWAIFAEPYGRCLFSAVNAFNPYPHEIFTGGLTLGIRYNFGK